MLLPTFQMELYVKKILKYEEKVLEGSIENYFKSSCVGGGRYIGNFFLPFSILQIFFTEK